MSTRTRLIALLAFIFATFALGVALLHQSHRGKAAAMLATLRAERSALFNRLLDLTGQTLMNFANDYSYWDELLEFVSRPDLVWARLNLDASLPTFNAHALWVLRPDGTVVYAASRELAASLPAPPLPPSALMSRLTADKFVHFFAATADGVLEIRTAPIQPSFDSARATTPAGWFLVARRWDEAHLANLRATFGGELFLYTTAPVAAPPATATAGVHLERSLPGWDDRAVGILHSRYNPPPLEFLLEENRSEMVLFVGCGLAVVAVLLAGVSRWVLIPLARLEQSLAGASPAPLADLRRDPGEFGRLARLVESSFTHRAALEREVEERRRAESALRASESSLRESAELRARLGRDLHDGVIQSIFAAGLGLEGARDMLRSDPTAATRRIEAALTSLNRTIREVRGFITGLEPESRDRVSFVQALRTLVETLQALHPARIRLELPGTLPPALNAQEEVHALQIVREAISNALRHGGAREIKVAFGAVDGRRELVVADDGAGFEVGTAATRGGGSGLANLAARAAEMQADLKVESAPGHGTRIIVGFGGSFPP